jgi:hypothetical protein
MSNTFFDEDDDDVALSDFLIAPELYVSGRKEEYNAADWLCVSP